MTCLSLQPIDGQFHWLQFFLLCLNYSTLSKETIFLLRHLLGMLPGAGSSVESRVKIFCAPIADRGYLINLCANTAEFIPVMYIRTLRWEGWE